MADWEVGDRAVCVDDGLICCHPPGRRSVYHNGSYAPRKGTVVKVQKVEPALDDDGRVCECGCVVLWGDDGSAGIARRFRKVRPDEHEACEEEFSILLKLSKQRVSA